MKSTRFWSIGGTHSIPRPTRGRRNLAQPQTNLNRKSLPGLGHTYWWYTRQDRKAIDRAFSGSVVEFWVHSIYLRRRGSCIVGPHEEFRWKLENVQGPGFHMREADTVLGASPFLDGRFVATGIRYHLFCI